MKKFLMAAVALGAMSATPAFAQVAAPQTVNFAVTGSVTASCGAVTDGTIAFGTIGITSSGALAANQSMSAAGQATYCNGVNTTVSVSHAALSNTVVAAPNFTSTIDFTPEVDFAGLKLNEGATQSLGARTGSMVVSAKNLTAAALPMAGNYSGSITVTLTPGA